MGRQSGSDCHCRGGWRDFGRQVGGSKPPWCLTRIHGTLEGSRPPSSAEGDGHGDGKGSGQGGRRGVWGLRIKRTSRVRINVETHEVSRADVYFIDSVLYIYRARVY